MENLNVWGNGDIGKLVHRGLRKEANLVFFEWWYERSFR